MRSVYFEEMDMFWSKYQDKVHEIGYIDFLVADEKFLQNQLSLEFKELFLEILANNGPIKKTRKEISYSVLKLRRLIALWNNKNVMTGNYDITFKDKDKYQEFPMFDKQNFVIEPTLETVRKIKVKIINNYIEDYNQYVDEQRLKGNTEPKYISNLKDLRLFFMSKLELDSKTATYLTGVYREGSARNEVRDFSENLKLL